MSFRPHLLIFAFGSMTFAASPGPTFYKTVLPIFQNHCQECHRPGEIGPFSLMSYESARPWAKSIRQAVLSKKMPPWDADDAHSVKMGNDRSLSENEIQTLVAWADSGAAAGDPKRRAEATHFFRRVENRNSRCRFRPGNRFPCSRERHCRIHTVPRPHQLHGRQMGNGCGDTPGVRSVVHHIVVHVRPPGSTHWSYLKVGEPCRNPSWKKKHRRYGRPKTIVDF